METGDLENALFQHQQAVEAQTKLLEQVLATMKALLGATEENSQALDNLTTSILSRIK